MPIRVCSNLGGRYAAFHLSLRSLQHPPGAALSTASGASTLPTMRQGRQAGLPALRVCPQGPGLSRHRLRPACGPQNQLTCQAWSWHHSFLTSHRDTTEREARVMIISTAEKAALTKAQGIFPPAGVPVRAARAAVVSQLPIPGSGLQGDLFACQSGSGSHFPFSPTTVNGDVS